MDIHAEGKIAVCPCFLGNLTKKNAEDKPYPAELCRSKTASSTIDRNNYCGYFRDF